MAYLLCEAASSATQTHRAPRASFSSLLNNYLKQEFEGHTPTSSTAAGDVGLGFEVKPYSIINERISLLTMSLYSL